jgi:hypothetical protein
MCHLFFQHKKRNQMILLVIEKQMAHPPIRFKGATQFLASSSSHILNGGSTSGSF